MTDSPQNVILLSADALRADHLSCYGYHRETSPVLDEFAEESIRFENAYSASSHTREAVPALLTGKYPDVAVDSKYQLATETIASTLSQEGYATAGFHSNPFVSRAYGFDEGFDHFDDDLHLGQNKLVALAQRALDKLRNRHYARATEINERSLKWVDSLDEEPFFLWNHYMDTHGPYEPPSEYAKLYTDQDLSGRDAQSLYKRAIDDPHSITNKEKQLLIDLYDGEIRYNDYHLGEFFDALRERDLFADSLIIVTADHGDAFGEHGYYEHPRYLHEEITKVPLFVRVPSGRNDVVETPASTLDIASTLDNVIKHDMVNNGTSLLKLSSSERTVFQQVRGSKNENIRRYAIRSSDSACFCEEDLNDESKDFSQCENSSMKLELEEFVENRNSNSKSNEEASNKDDMSQIENRLRALGYKE
ncbi:MULTISPECIES: sulfatase [Haloarcula]|uniref:sulfatase n=1 Tax=Haloarcula TaxID=2237 RepID=UPI000F8E5CCB|nr:MULTISPECIES: sulfatase [Haloarcula]NHX38170.1 sulfatase [Haloarcula sp. R1-2]